MRWARVVGLVGAVVTIGAAIGVLCFPSTPEAWRLPAGIAICVVLIAAMWLVRRLRCTGASVAAERQVLAQIVGSPAVICRTCRPTVMAAEAAQAAVARSALAILQHMDNIAKNWYNEVAFELDPASKSLNQHAKLLAGSKHAVLAHDKALLHASKFLPCGEELAGMPNDVAKRITDQVREFRRAASSKDVATMARTIGNGKEVADQFVKQIAGFRDTVQARVDQAVARYQREIDGLRSRWLCRPPV